LGIFSRSGSLDHQSVDINEHFIDIFENDNVRGPETKKTSFILTFAHRKKETDIIRQIMLNTVNLFVH
jgi:hypothetical protein